MPKSLHKVHEKYMLMKKLWISNFFFLAPELAYLFILCFCELVEAATRLQGERGIFSRTTCPREGNSCVDAQVVLVEIGMPPRAVLQRYSGNAKKHMRRDTCPLDWKKRVKEKVMFLVGLAFCTFIQKKIIMNYKNSKNNYG